MLDYEKKYYSDEIQYIVGCDEAGRGPLAGPVVAAAVILPKDYKNENLLENSTISGLSPTIRLKNILTSLYINSKPEPFKIPNNVKEFELDLLDYNSEKLTLANQNTPENLKIKAY